MLFAPSAGNQKFKLTKGLMMTTNDIVTKCLLNVLCTMPKPDNQPLPKFIALSTSGVTRSSRSTVPLALKPVYSYLIQHHLQDKLAMERIIYHCAGWEWNSRVDGEPSVEITGENWKERAGLPQPGSLKDAMIIRAALLNDGDCVADVLTALGKKDKAPYRVADGDVSGYAISRKDVAHFIFDAVSNHWEQYGGKGVGIAY